MSLRTACSQRMENKNIQRNLAARRLCKFEAFLVQTGKEKGKSGISGSSLVLWFGSVWNPCFMGVGRITT